MRLKDGETQILAGLINDEDRITSNEVPGIGNLPIVGRLFKSQKDDLQRSEILLSITPRIVRSIQRPDMLFAEFESGTASSIGAKTVTLPSSTENIEQEGSQSPDSPTSDRVSTQAQEEDLDQTLSVAPPTAETGAVQTQLTWVAPAQIKVGEVFNAVVMISSQNPLQTMPILLNFDPQFLQATHVQDGNFFKQAGGQTDFIHSIDTTQGKISISLMRQGRTESDARIDGAGSLLTVSFKAIKPVDATDISARPEPTSIMPISIPVVHTLNIIP